MYQPRYRKDCGHTGSGVMGSTPGVQGLLGNRTLRESGHVREGQGDPEDEDAING